MESINVKGKEIAILSKGGDEYISLTDIARYKNNEDPRFIVKNWLRNRDTIEFLGIWELIHNSDFNRVEFDSVRNEAGLNSFSLSPSKWIRKTGAIGLISKFGRYGSGTFAHEDIALEFASWVSPEFKLYFVKEFRRLKSNEMKRQKLDWNLRRELSKINHKILSDSISENLIPPKVSLKEANKIYASEMDLLNKALFGMTAKEWSLNNSLKGNIRDYADLRQLVVLSNLEAINSEMIRDGFSSKDRLLKLNKIARFQMKSLVEKVKVLD